MLFLNVGQADVLKHYVSLCGIGVLLASASASPAWAQSQPQATPPVRRETKQAPKASKSSKQKSKVEHTPTVVVTGSRRQRLLKNTVTQTEVITRRQILRTAARRLSELLETYLGIQVTQPAGAGSGLLIQGLDSKYILLLVDGQRVNGRLRGNIDLDRFPLEEIERIEIVKGATSALYGSDAIGGVINIITRQFKKPLQANGSFRYGYGGGSLFDLNASAGGRRKKWRGGLTLSLLSHDPWDLDKSNKGTTGSSDRMAQIHGRTSYHFSRRFTLSLRGHYQIRDRNGIDANSVGAVYDRRNLTETSNGSLFLNALIGSNLRLRWRSQISYFRDQFLNQRRNASPVQAEQTRDWIGQSVLQTDWMLNEHHILSVGFEGLYEQLETDRLADNFAERLRGAVYTQYEWMLMEPIRISIVPGIRAEYDAQFGAAVTPKLSFRLDPVRGLAIRVAYGFGFRAPSFKDLYLRFENNAAGYVVIGNDQLQPEYARNLQAGLEWSRWSWMRFQLRFFRNELEGLINTKFLPPQSGQSVQITYENIDDVLLQGVESQLVLLHQQWLQFSVGYSFLYSEDRKTALSLLGRAAHNLNVQLFVRPPKTGLALSMRGSWIGARPAEDDTNGDGQAERIILPSYLLLHARLSYTFWRGRAELFLSLNNILNEGDSRFLPIRPRTVFSGLRVRY